ncbi:mycofactocin biosynthesis peptidyl-dipeptidase MftE [Tsukamurella paurometabola]|uniref:Mycofactocin biosynthesis peptidyl-dipeptidase MftE n=1 Tax=Tsukamurella paurometabola TaxID=2061 RepID=A0ABS5NA25_TSUPA|nr:mycofactocin biosynthesis peptidyl-dipeptidase MftE [Tsukamurella paurometabola]MBS4101106.1 mycofactocin biosynthesis peptidyl-dipeptidase MftE [Tsukamurella paurometabola]
MHALADHRWPEVRGAALVAVPVGSLEQHGPHLPLDTDTVIATAAVAGLPGVVAAPAIPYGASGEHEGFPGTVSIGAAALETVLLEYGRSIARWAGSVLFVNGHGGNAEPVRRATTRLREEGRDAAWVACAVPGGDAHAGATETALMLHLDPGRVRMPLAVPGETAPIAELMPRLRAVGLAGVAANGVLGDPTGATADAGAQVLARLVDDLRGRVRRWRPGADGELK